MNQVEIVHGTGTQLSRIFRLSHPATAFHNLTLDTRTTSRRVGGSDLLMLEILHSAYCILFYY